MRYPIDQKIEAKKLIKKTKEIIAEEKEILAKEKEEEIIADFVMRMKKALDNHRNELLKSEIHNYINYFIVFLLGFLSGLCIEIIVETLKK